MSASRTERLLNLLLALLNTKYGLSRAVLREKVYHDEDSSDAAFGRMFERDKVDLRNFGFEIETIAEAGFSADDPTTTRYRIGKESNRLPDVHLTPAEATVLVLAATLWERAALGGAAASALRKLQAAGDLGEVELPAGVQPRIKPAGKSFEAIVNALNARQPVSFGYRAASTGAEERRRVEPWGLGSRFGQWYLVGFDQARGAKRFFRLSRMTTSVELDPKGSYELPAGFDARRELDGLEELPIQDALLEVAAGKLLGLRRRAVPAPQGSEAGRGHEPAQGRDVISVPFRDSELFAEELASYGPRVKVLAPGDLSTAVVRRLEAAEAALSRPAVPVDFPAQSGGRTRKRTSEDQLSRMLQLVPFLVHNQGLPIQEVAERFGVSRKELVADLQILICSGLPEGYPDDLFDIDWEDEHVYIHEHLELNRPVRFSEEEASALLTGLATLGNLPAQAGLSGEEQANALESVTVKLAGAAGEAGRAAASLAAPPVEPAEAAFFETITAAIKDGQQLALRYFSPQRDAVSERNVDPLRLYSQDSTWYFEAYCHAKAGIRNFRLDRIEDVAPNGKPVSTPASADTSVPVKLYTPSDEDVVVILELTAQGAHLADDYYAERTAELPGGGLLAEVRFGSVDWLPMFIAQHGGAARIVQPAGLAEASAEWIRSALAQYRD
ncbi:WYL domain-containing protein [Arthrobacter sp. SW1]|uniref:helix-turn-helix transcriptional regulator n=1 Tax=Arthrobacter sp. SW1 TaxID=1920889 RepID=UPI000877BE06|nr:WYL domain-containing protein [Arthrobacter sp. SW1]OFI37999.1 WYL domain-containing protein [Arthrobacter sp. SW1]